MKEQLHIVLITVGLFAGGLLIGIWTQRTRPIVAPPAPVLGEFGGPHGPKMMAGWGGPEEGDLAFQRFAPGHARAIVTMNRHLAALEPQIKEFQSLVDAIEKNFRDNLNQLLTADQQEKLAAIEADEDPMSVQVEGPMVPPPPPEVAEGRPLPPDAQGQVFIYRNGGRPPFPLGGWLMMSMIIYQPSLDHLTSELKLDVKKEAAVKDLMVERRRELLALIDKSPPPTLGFGDTLP
jgi:hypothetical protein